MSTLVAQTISNGTVSTSSANVIQGSAKAWLNYNAVTSTIRGSFNVSSVVINSAGDITTNFTNAMPDANYAWNVNQILNGSGNNDIGASGLSRQQQTNSWGTTFIRTITMSHSNTSQENPLALTIVINR